MKKSVAVVLVFLFLLSAASIASATNGYFSHGFSIKNKALAGAGVALPLDSLAASMNPAGMVYVGTRLDDGLTLFNPNREYTVQGNQSPPPAFGLAPGTVESDSKWFLIPALGFNKMLNDKNSLGISVFGNGGMNTDYDEKTFFLSASTGVDLMQLFIAPTYAVKVHPKHAIGISPILAYQSVPMNFDIKPTYVIGVLLGGLIFGVGFAVGGFCPGTCVVAVGEGRRDAWFAIIGGIVGAFGYTLAYSTLEGILIQPMNYGNITLQDAEHLPSLVVAVAMAALVLFIVWKLPTEVKKKA